VICLIESVYVLPVDFSRELVSLLASLMSRSELEGQDEQVIYYGVGLLWCALHL
jgi:hypothetical protein